MPEHSTHPVVVQTMAYVCIMCGEGHLWAVLPASTWRSHPLREALAVVGKDAKIACSGNGTLVLK